MITTVLKGYPKVTIEEDFNQKRVRDWLTRYYIDHKQGVSMVNLTLDKLEAILVACNAEIVSVEWLEEKIEQAIELAEPKYTDEEIERGHANPLERG